MSDALPLRLYANPIKQALYLLGSAVFVAIGFAMVDTSNVRTKPFTLIMGWFAIIVFGLGTIVFLITFAVHVVFRRPVLHIDRHGWDHVAGLSPQAQHVEWQRIERIALFRQQLQSGPAFSQTQYQLILFGSADPAKQALQALRARAQRRYPMLRGAILGMPLNAIFFRATPDHCAQLLQRIEHACANEIALYRIQVSRELIEI
jgi:hypothetical protein